MRPGAGHETGIALGGASQAHPLRVALTRTRTWANLAQTSKIAIGAKHSMIFTGQLFETNDQYKQLKSILLGTRPSPAARPSR